MKVKVQNYPTTLFYVPACKKIDAKYTYIFYLAFNQCKSPPFKVLN